MQPASGQLPQVPGDVAHRPLQLPIRQKLLASSENLLMRENSVDSRANGYQHSPIDDTQLSSVASHSRSELESFTGLDGLAMVQYDAQDHIGWAPLTGRDLPSNMRQRSATSQMVHPYLCDVTPTQPLSRP